MTMFHQMLYFLTLKDEMTNDALQHFQKLDPDAQRPKYPSLLSEKEISGVIFD